MSELELWKLAGYSDCHAAIICLIFSAVWAVVFALYKTDVKKQIENLKAKNEKINYITNIKHETEFDMYRNLSEISFNLVNSVSKLYSNYCEDSSKVELLKNNIDLNMYENARKNCDIFQCCLYSYAPFIKENLFKDFEEFLKQTNTLIGIYHYIFYEQTPFNIVDSYINYNTSYKEVFNCTKLHREIINNIRTTLYNLMDGDNE